MHIIETIKRFWLRSRYYPDNYPSGVMIKFGKENHLKQIVSNQLRFSPSQTYISIEEKQHNHGQGDLLEGKWRIHAEKFSMFHPETNEYLGSFDKKADFTVSIQDVNNMPVFCLSHFRSSHFEGRKLCVKTEEYEKILKDFPEATHALIVLEPDKFVKSVSDTIGHKIVSDDIHYFDYDINDLRMAVFLTTGDENSSTQGPFFGSESYEDRYRHLLCKDDDFSDQNEYRLIVLDELISLPKFYDFEFKGKYLIVPISRLKKKIKL